MGIALGAGGARGFCHIGVLEALEDAGHTPDVVAGCSMGALVGSAWAAGKLPELKAWALSMTRRRMVGYVDLRLSDGGLMHGAAIEEVLDDLGLPENIEDLDKPFLAVATDMGTGREVWMEKGPLARAVRASVAIPGLFSPINVDGRYLLDGGLVNPVPVSACRALGARTIIGVDPNAKHGRRLWSPSDDTGLLDALGGRDFMARLPNALRRFLPDGAGDEDTSEAPDLIDVMSTSIDIVTEYIRKTREAADPADLMLEADLPDLTILEFDRAQHAIDEGRRITQAALARRTASSADR